MQNIFSSYDDIFEILILLFVRFSTGLSEFVSSLRYSTLPGLLLQTLRSCDCGAGECKAGDKYVEQLEDVLRFSMPKDKCGAFFAESIQVYNLGVCV